MFFKHETDEWWPTKVFSVPLRWKLLWAILEMTASLMKYITKTTGNWQHTWVANFKILRSPIFKFLHSQDFQKAYSDHEVKITDIQTYPRFLVDALMASIWKSYVSLFSTYYIHKLRCPLHPPCPSVQRGDDNTFISAPVVANRVKVPA